MKEELREPIDHHLLTFFIAGQLFGVPVLQVNDVLRAQKLTRTPLSPPAVQGVMNLRGRIVTAVDVRKCLHQPRNDNQETMNVVIDQNGELFSLTIDSVGEVLQLTDKTYEKIPATLDTTWKNVSSGIHKLDDKILVVLDVDQLLQIAANG